MPNISDKEVLQALSLLKRFIDYLRFKKQTEESIKSKVNSVLKSKDLNQYMYVTGGAVKTMIRIKKSPPKKQPQRKKWQKY